MNTESNPHDDRLAGPGQIQWNAGGWFGGAIGGSAFMVIVSGFLIAYDQVTLALIPLASFAIVLGVSIVFWNLKNRIYPFTGLFCILAVMAIVIPITWITVEAMASQNALRAMNWPDSDWITVFVCALVPCVMLKFWFTEKNAANKG